MTLYRANLRLSQEIFSVLSVFEVVLRNQIDTHYKTMFYPLIGNDEWLLHATNPGGRGYTHDKLVAELTFGFWRFQFASKEFMAAGSSLHRIFLNRPLRTNHTDIFNKLGFVNKIRNRIAHHEPICFGPGNTISTMYALEHYNVIIELFQWLDCNPADLLYGIDKVQREIAFINSL